MIKRLEHNTTRLKRKYITLLKQIYTTRLWHHYITWLQQIYTTRLWCMHITLQRQTYIIIIIIETLENTLLFPDFKKTFLSND